MSSLTDTLMSRLGASEIQQLGDTIGADPAATGKGLAAAIPMLFGALAQNAGNEEGRTALEGALRKDHDGSVLDGLSGFFGAGATEPGKAILGHVLGGRQATAEQGLSAVSGLGKDQAGKLLALVAPLVLGALGKARREGALDAGGLAGLLAGERQGAAGALGGLSGLLDRDGDGSVADDVLGGLAKGLKGKLFGG
jgi:hypothetical protein